MAVTLKENVIPEIILEEPKPVIEEPEPRREDAVGEDAVATAVRETRDRLAKDRVEAEKAERKERGPKVGQNIFNNKIQKKRLFLALGTKGKNGFVQKNPHKKISKLEFKETVRLAKATFEKSQSITYKRYKLYNRPQKTGETLEAFYAALTAQAAKSALGALEDESLRGLLISKIRSAAVQDNFMFETLTQDEVLKRAIKIRTK